jgi:hypothetical protein
MSRPVPDTTGSPRKAAIGAENRSQPAEAASSESEFESTVRSLQELRSVAVAEMSTLFGLELDRYRDAWRHTFDSVKGTLAELERACDAAVGKNPVQATSALSSIIERLVAAATTATEAAAQRARAESRAEVLNVQQTLSQVEGELQRTREELQRQREELSAVVDSLAKEQTASARAEAALQEAQNLQRQTVSSYESQVQALRSELWGIQQQVESERAVRAKLVTAIRQAVEIEGPGAKATVATAAQAEFKPESDRKQVVTSPEAAKPAPDEESIPYDSKTPPDPALVTYVQHLLDTAEAMYNADASAKRGTPDLLDRLTDHLRSARVLFLQRTGVPTDRRESTLFDQLLTHRLNTTADTAFGRHLGIAAHACLSERSRER